jgi:hypothetical protein
LSLSQFLCSSYVLRSTDFLLLWLSKAVKRDVVYQYLVLGWAVEPQVSEAMPPVHNPLVVYADGTYQPGVRPSAAVGSCPINPFLIFFDWLIEQWRFPRQGGGGIHIIEQARTPGQLIERIQDDPPVFWIAGQICLFVSSGGESGTFSEVGTQLVLQLIIGVTRLFILSQATRPGQRA